MKTSIAVIIVSLFVATQCCYAEKSGGNETFSAKEQSRLIYQPDVDPDGTEKLFQVMATNRFSLNNMRKIQQMLRELDTREIPVEPLMNKVYEGLAKDIQPNRIVMATERVRQRYEYAYREARRFSLNEKQTDNIGNTTAKTLAAGLNTRDCDQIMEQLRTRIRLMERDHSHSLITETLKTSRVMAHRNVSSTMIAELVTKALENSYNADDMAVMRQTFTKTVRTRNAAMVAQQFSYNISNGIKAGQLGTTSNNNQNSKSAWGDGPRGAQGSGPGSDSNNGTGSQSSSNGNDGSGNSGGAGGSSGDSGSSSGGQGNAGSSSGGNSQGSGGKGGSGRK